MTTDNGPETWSAYTDILHSAQGGAKVQIKRFYTCPDLQPDKSPAHSDCSDYVDDDWSSIEDGDNPRTSREAQEAEIEDKYRSALNFLQEGNVERVVSIFSALLVHPIMAKYHVSDWAEFDWKKAMADTQKIVPNMAKLFFNINLAMVGLVKDPFQFYVQALSIRPDFKDLWFNCGQCAMGQRDWRSAGFCMAQCEDEFRALEALLLIHYFSQDYLQCMTVLQRVFDVCPEHSTGHVIRRLISESSPFWAEYHSKIFAPCITEFNVEKSRREEILRTFHHFQQETFRSYDKSFKIFPSISPMPKWAPLAIKLQTKMRVEEIAKLFCNIFDRINEFSSFAEQSVTFEFELPDHCGQQTKEHSSDDDEMERGTEEEGGQMNVVTTAVCNNIVEQLLGADDMRQHSVPDEFSATDCAAGLADNLLRQIAFSEPLINGNGGDGEMDNDGQQQPFPQCTSVVDPHQRQEIIEFRQFASNCGQGIAQETEAVPDTLDELCVRRSTRLVDELNWFGISNKQKSEPATNRRQMDVLTLMGFDENCLEEHQISTSDHRRSVQFVPDAISAPQRLASADELIAKLVDESSIETTKFPSILHSFLTWMAFDQQPFVVLSLAEVDAFREVYARWSGLLCLSNCSFNPSDLAVHQLAAELGSHRALSILQAFYGRRLLQQQKASLNTNDESSSNDGRDRNALECRETLAQFARRTMDTTDNNNDVFRWVFERIQAEQQQQRRADDHTASTVVDRSGSVQNRVNSQHQQNECSQSNVSIICRQLEVRYRWLIANLLPDELGLPNSEAYHFINTYSQLSAALDLMESEWTLLSHAEFDISCLTVRNLKEMLRKRVREFQLQHIDYLTVAKRYDELRNVLLHQYDWTSDSDDAHIKQKFLIIHCIRETDNALVAIGEWVSKILSDICHNRLPAGVLTKRSLRRCLHLLDELFPTEPFERSAQTEHFFASVGCYLGKLVQQTTVAPPHEKLAHCTDLWRWCYKVAKFREGDQLCVAELKRFYECCSNDPAFLNRRLPTKTTLLLAKGHEVLGKAKKCSRNEGLYLRMLIEEFLRTSRDPSVRCVLAADEYADIRESVVSETMQCLRCCLSDKFAQSRVRSNRMVDHGSKLQWPVGWEFAAKAIELILPPKLPEICSDRRVPSDLADLLTRAFEHLLAVDEAQLRCLDELLRTPFRLELEEKFDSDGLCCGYEERLQMGEEGRVRLEEPLKAKKEREGGGHALNSELSAKCIYLLAHYHYRSGTDCEGEWLRKCLAIGGSLLPCNIVASAWYALGRSFTYGYAIKSDEELLDRMDAYVFPFKMALFLHWEFAESHLDVGTIIYQLRTRFARFKAQRDVSKELRCKAQKTMEGMLLKCKVHFCMALRFNDSPKDIAWLSNYFLAKIAEKLGDLPGKVLDLYYRCALALEEEGIQYLTKINKVKQTYFEPLEIHYKVHAFALRYLRALNAPSFPPRTAAQCASDLATIRVYLALFRHHGVQRRSLEDGHWSETEFYDQPNPAGETMLVREEHQSSQRPNESGNSSSAGGVPASTTCCSSSLLATATDEEAEVEDLVHSLLCASDLQLEIVQMCRTAFDIILQRFPHYKTYYQVARAFYDERNFARSTDLLFDKLFLTGRKQRCNNFLENIVEIKRSDFERNGSFPYHLYKIVKLTAAASFKSGGIGRLKDLVVALTAYKGSSSSREILGKPMIRELLGLVLRGFKSLAEKQQAQYGHDIQHLGKLIEHLEGVIGRLKRDGRCQTERSELETTLIACIQRRDKMSQQSHNGNATAMPSSTCPKYTQSQLLSPLSQQHHQQLHRVMAQLPIGLKSPTTHSQQQSQPHPLSALFQPLPDPFMRASSSASASPNLAALQIPTTSAHHLQNSAPPRQRLKPLDSVGFKMLQKLLPTLGLDRLGMVEKFCTVKTLFERLGYEFPVEKAAEIGRKVNEPHSGGAQSGQATLQVQAQHSSPSTSSSDTSVNKVHPFPTKPASEPPKRMTGMPPSVRSRCKMQQNKSIIHHQQPNEAGPSVSAHTSTAVSSSAERNCAAVVANTGGQQQTVYAVSGGTGFVTPKRSAQQCANSSRQKLCHQQQRQERRSDGTQTGGGSTTTFGGSGPPPKVRRKNEVGAALPPAAANQGPSESQIITLNDDDIIPLRCNNDTNDTQLPKHQQKVLESPRQNAQIQKQTRPCDAVPLARKSVPSNDTSPVLSASSSSPTAVGQHLDPFAGLSQSALSSMLTTLTSQLNRQQQQQSFQSDPRLVQKHASQNHPQLMLHQQRPHPLASSPSSTPVSLHPQQHRMMVQQQHRNQQQQISPQTVLRSIEQQQPELLLSHFMNLQRIEQLRQIIGERFALNWNSGGSQQRN